MLGRVQNLFSDASVVLVCLHKRNVKISVILLAVSI